jgi:adenine-specific DNA-methyltransferase
MSLTDIAKLLGKPYFQAPNCLIYNMDCLEALKLLPDKFVDLTVTSPPYNIGKEYEKFLVLDEYLNWCEQWIAEVYRVTIDRGAFWLNLGYLSIRDRAKAIGISYLLWDKVPFYLIQEVVSNYGAPVAGSKFFSPRNEKFIWYVKNQDKYTFNLDEGLFWICSGNGSAIVSLTQDFQPVPREVLFL